MSRSHLFGLIRVHSPLISLSLSLSLSLALTSPTHTQQHLGETDELAEARATATATVDARNKWVGEFNKKMKKLKLSTELDTVTPPPAAIDGAEGPESVGNSVLELINLRWVRAEVTRRHRGTDSIS